MAVATLLALHHALVGALVVLFVWRAWFAWWGRRVPYPWLRRGLPDTVDISVLATGILLAVELGFAPWRDAWFALKLLLIVLYIAAGFLSFSPRASLVYKRAGVVSALLLLALVAYLAVHKTVPFQ